METQQMINEVYIWVLSGVLGFLLMILVFVGKSIAKKVDEKLDVLVKATIQQTEQIKTLFKSLNNAQLKIDKLKKEYLKVKLDQLSCKNFEQK